MDPNEICELKQQKNIEEDINELEDDINAENEFKESESNPEESMWENELEVEESMSENELEDQAKEIDEVESEEIDEVTRTKSGRIVKPPSKLNLNQCHLQTQSHERTEYSIETAKVIARNMIGFNSKCDYQFIETFGLKK